MKKTFLAACAALLLMSAAPLRAETVLNIGMAAADVSQLDPHRTTTTQDKPLSAWMFNGLVRFKPGSFSLEELQPDLAESWESSPDKLTWTFKLRHGVQFHRNFGEFTADDVVFSVKRAASSNSSSFSADYAAIDTIEALDPYTVRIKLKNVIPSLLGILANYNGGMIVSKKAVEQLGDGFAQNPVGTGPFAFVERRANEAVILAANEKYFRGKPKIDKINYRLIPADAARDLAFKTGELDIVYGRQDQRWAEAMKKETGVIVDVLTPAELSLISLNITSKPLDDKRVRLAIAQAVNRAQMVQFKGELTALAGVSVVPTGYLGTDEKAVLPPFDIAAAKKLLADAGYPNGVAVKSVQTSLPTMLSTGQILQAQLKQAGIDLQLEVVDHQTFHSNIRKDLSQVTQYSAARFPVADIYLTQFFHSRSIVGTPTAVTNFSHCSVADKEIDAARVETDPVKQKALWIEAQKKIIDEVCAVVLYEQAQVWAHKTNVDFGYELKSAIHLGPVITELTTKK